MTKQEIYNKFVECGKKSRFWINECKLMLPTINRLGIWKEKNFSSIYVFAKKLAGLSEWQVDDALRVLRKIEDKPDLMKVAREKGLGAVRPVSTIATTENQKFWADKAESVGINELEVMVRDHRNKEKEESFEKSQEEDGASKRVVNMELEKDVALQLKRLSKGDYNGLMKEFLEMRRRELEREKPEAMKSESRHIPAPIKKFVKKRSRCKCEFPGCKADFSEMHHTNRFALDKVHDPDKLFALCQAHHKLMHRGLVENEHLSPENWMIRNAPDTTSKTWMIDTRVQQHYR